jgi:hypothetical protein
MLPQTDMRGKTERRRTSPPRYRNASHSGLVALGRAAAPKRRGVFAFPMGRPIARRRPCDDGAISSSLASC